MKGYKDAIRKSMAFLAKDRKRVFLGYCTKVGLAGGTLDLVKPKKLIEMPAAENLVAGVAIGMSLRGYKPVVWFERMDFILNALDAIVNHADKMAEISRGDYVPKVIFRVNVGGSAKPLYTGPTHTQDFTESLRKMMTTIRVLNCKTPMGVTFNYEMAAEIAEKESVIVVERRDLW